MYGFDKSAPERLWIMVKNYAQLDFGDGFFRDAKVIDLIRCRCLFPSGCGAP